MTTSRRPVWHWNCGRACRRGIELGGSDFTATLNPRVELPFGLTVTLRPPFALDAQAGGILPNGEVTFTLAADRTQAAEPFVIFGEPDTSRMSFRRLAVEGSLGFRCRLDPALRRLPRASW